MKTIKNMSKNERNGILVSIAIWTLLMIMVVGYFDERILHEIGKYIAVIFGVCITLCVWLGIYSIYKANKDEDNQERD